VHDYLVPCDQLIFYCPHNDGPRRSGGDGGDNDRCKGNNTGNRNPDRILWRGYWAGSQQNDVEVPKAPLVPKGGQRWDEAKALKAP